MTGSGIKLATSKLEFSLHTIDIGHFEMARVVSNCTMGLFWGTKLTLVMSNKRSRSVPKAPAMMQFDTKPPISTLDLSLFQAFT